MKKISTICLIFSICSLTAQQTGLVNLPSLGIEFTIPSGWIGQETNDAFVMGSNTEEGILLLMLHDYQTLDQLRKEAETGYTDAGIQLRKVSPIDELSSTSIGAKFAGTMQGQAVKSYMAALLNPYGQGVTALAITTSEMYNDLYQRLVMELINSVKYSPIPQTATGGPEDWKSLLIDTKLTYMHSYSSSGGSYGGYSTYGGYSDQIEISLCGQGYFIYNDASSSTFDSGGGFGYTNDTNRGNGKWSVGGNQLRLDFNDGTVRTYQLSMQDGKTFLDGKRYFRVGKGDPLGNGPTCQ